MQAAQEVSVLVKIEELKLKVDQLSLAFLKREHEYDHSWVHRLMLLDRTVQSFWDLVPDPPSPASSQEFDFSSDETENNNNTTQ